VSLRHFEPDGGFTSLQFAVMAFLTMMLFAATVNMVAMQYQRGAVRLAVDEGARRGASVSGKADDCEALAESILRSRDSGLLRGSLGDGIEITCEVRGPEMVATARGSSRWWFGGIPDMTFAIEGRAVVETFGEGP
jgi:hypothetical protein